MATDDRNRRTDNGQTRSTLTTHRHSPSHERLRELSLPHVDLGTCPPDQRAKRLSELTTDEFVLILGNDLRLVPLIVDWLSQRFVEYAICDRRMAGRLGVALGEALVNAIVHGNLEVGSDIRDDPGNVYDKLIEARRLDPRFRKRRVRLLCHFSENAGSVTVRDEGPGFDVTEIPDPTQDEYLSRPYGRGILLIRAFFDEVDYSAQGNSVRMLKRKSESPTSHEAASSPIAIPSRP